MTIRIGANPIAWSNDDANNPWAANALENCLAEARKPASGDGLGPSFPRSLATAPHPRPLRPGAGVRLGSSELLRRTAAEEIAAVQRHLSLLKAMDRARSWSGAETTGCIHGLENAALRRPRLDAGQWQEFGARLTAVAEYLLAHGIRMTITITWGRWSKRAEEIDLLMENTGAAVGLLLDTGHVTFAGGDPVAVAKKMGANASATSITGMSGRRCSASQGWRLGFLAAVIAGVTPSPATAASIFPRSSGEVKAAGYCGDWLVIEAEQDPAKANPLAYALRVTATCARSWIRWVSKMPAATERLADPVGRRALRRDQEKGMNSDWGKEAGGRSRRLEKGDDDQSLTTVTVR